VQVGPSVSVNYLSYIFPKNLVPITKFRETYTQGSTFLHTLLPKTK
jgi:hypothetical protein